MSRHIATMTGHWETEYDTADPEPRYARRLVWYWDEARAPTEAMPLVAALLPGMAEWLGKMTSSPACARIGPVPK